MMVLTSCWKFGMPLTDRIEVNPEVMLGKPVIRGTRIPVELIVLKLREGASERTSLTRIRDSRVRTFRPTFATPMQGL